MPSKLPSSREEWADSDFDIPDGVQLHALSNRDDDDDDWDVEMDLGKTGGAKAQAVGGGMVARAGATSAGAMSVKSFSSGSGITIRPPISKPEANDDDDEGASTIKASDIPLTLKPAAPKNPPPPTIDEDFEDAFALPADLTQLSLAPLSLNHKSSKTSLEWGDKDSTTSSQSSDAYSSLGFADASPHSNSTSTSLPGSETEDEDDDLDGLVIPTALFESKQSARQLNKILATKKTFDPAATQFKVAKPNPEEDFEAGLIIEDDIDLSPSRLLSTSQNGKRALNRTARAHSIPPPKPSTLRPPSRAKLERSKSPPNPPPSSQRQLQKIRNSPPSRPSSRSQYQPFPPPPIPSPTPSPPTSFLTPKPGSLRGQKSTSGLKPPTPPATARLTRKASLSVIENAQKQSSRNSIDGNNQAGPSRYEAPTVASRAKTLKGSTSRIQDFKVPPTRPTTPSANTAALRLTMPTQSRIKARPSLSQVFGNLGPTEPPAKPPATPSTSPLPRPPSSLSVRTASRNGSRPTPTAPPTPPAPLVLKKPRKPRPYGDGTELDGIEDLPLNTDKEGRFRVHPKSSSNRIPAASFERPLAKSAAEKPAESISVKGSIRRSKRDISSVNGVPLLESYVVYC